MSTIKFELDKLETATARKFTKKHAKKCKGKHGAEFTYLFSETGIGVAATVVCTCGKEKNVTNYSNW